MRLGVSDPQEDVVAHARTDSDIDRVLQQDWQGRGLLWCNPPLKFLAQVIDNVVEQGVEAIIIVPHWTRQRFFEMAVKYTQRTHYYNKATLIFHEDGENLGG